VVLAVGLLFADGFADDMGSEHIQITRAFA
jgi:hypothetical protein